MRARRAAPGTAGGRAQPDPADGGGFAVAPLPPCSSLSNPVPRRRQSRCRPGSPWRRPAGRSRCCATRTGAVVAAPAPRQRAGPLAGTGSRPRYATRGNRGLGGGPVREPARRPCRGAALPRSGGRLGTDRLHADISDGNSPGDPTARSHGRQGRRHRRRARPPACGHRDRRQNGRAAHRRSRR